VASTAKSRAVLRASHHLARSFGFLLSFVSYELDEGGAFRYFGIRLDAVEEILREVDSA